MNDREIKNITPSMTFMKEKKRNKILEIEVGSALNCENVRCA